MTVRGYGLRIDWSRAGTFGGTLEDATGYVLDDPVLEVSYGRERTQDSAETPAGKMTFSLRNDNREFSPENGSSPIAGRVLPGCRARFDKLYNGVLYTLIDGVLDDLDVDPNAPARDFTGTILDAWGRPDAEKLSTPLYSGIRTGTAIGLILDAIGWTGQRDIDPGATVMPWWWEEGGDAATAVSKLVASEGPPAIAYVQGGTFVFRDRHHRLVRTESTTSNGSFAHTIPFTYSATGPLLGILDETFAYDHGLRNISNSATFFVDQRAAGSLVDVWSTDSPITLDVGEVAVIEAKASDPFINAITPVDDDIEVQSGTVTVGLSRTSGQSALITLTAGGAPVVITRLALRACPVAVARTVKVSEEDVSSVGIYGRQSWPNEAPWANAYDARVIAQRVVALYATNRPVVTFEIDGVLGDAYLAQALARKISDRITVRNDALGINGDFIIERIKHTIVGLGIRHRVEFTCQVTDPVQPAGALTFDVAGLGFNQGAFAVSGIDNAASMFRFDTAGQGFNDGRFAT